MPASVTILDERGELDELEPVAMSDREHLATFGWAWDDPNAVEVEA